MLDLALTGHLLERFPEQGQGDLSRVRNQVRSARFCAVVARLEGLGDRLLAAAPPGRRAAAARLAVSRPVLADLAESALGAIYLHDGWEAVRVATLDAFAPLVDHALDPRIDAKSALQESLQRQGRRVAYELVETTGPAHDRLFRVAAVIDGVALGEGEGGSRRVAEQLAARRALAALEREGRA